MEQPLSPQASQAADNTRPVMSLPGRLVNIFATPGEVFEELRERPPAHANWLIPVLLLCLAGIISTWVVFSQPSILQNMREAKEKVLEKQFAQMPPAQRQQAIDLANKFSSPIILKAAGTVQAIAFSFVQLFAMAFILWGIGQIFLKADFSYLKAMEVAGLAGMISVLGKILSMLLIVITGNMAARLSPVALLSKFDPTNPVHLMLGSLNLITLWYIGLLALGLGKLSRKSAFVPALCLYGLWALYSMTTITLGLLAQRLRM